MYLLVQKDPLSLANPLHCIFLGFCSFALIIKKKIAFYLGQPYKEMESKKFMFGLKIIIFCIIFKEMFIIVFSKTN